MNSYPIPFNEEARLKAARAAPGLTRENEPLFEALTDTARMVLDCPIAHISVVEEDSQWYKCVVGVELDEMPKENSFCTHTIMSDAPMIVPDLSLDPRFHDHPMVREGGPKARFYAGVPLILSSGYRFGSLCALDFVPHAAPTDKQMDMLASLARAVIAALEKAPAKDAAPDDGTGYENFVALVGHELRTPLTVSLGALAMLRTRLVDGIEARLASSSHASTQHLGKLIESILHFSNAETGELRLNEQETDLAALLAEISETHQPIAQISSKTVTGTSGVTPLMMRVDPEQLRIAITSIMLNAVQHGGASITTALRLDADGNAEILITDDGSLGDHVELDALYRPFVVGGDLDHRGTDTSGLGLGLPLTRKLVGMHGGAFEIHADAHSTTACIRLPAWRAAAAV
ncbi:GAF domain-containing sensor histidine kinase [Roseovarius arcticus]|uniref:GAF domain-containing sensor histidine kinase n=1 Tax=Roseovarius arcticus TaxID=2547404 RepID=UPI001110267D|nr:GAF domain-containing sensor histidine kinase [Roseovarius arcticus]